jgi:hypothetical protein
MKANLLMILLPLTLIACGKSGGEDTSKSSIPLKEGESIANYIDYLNLDANAPKGLGTLFSLDTDVYNQSSLSLCTWFLVGENKAMTNSHCIPQNLKKDKKLNCSTYLRGKIQTSAGAKKVSCKKLIYSSTISESVITNNDYALMEINEDITNAETFKLKRNGVTEGETLAVLSMTHHVTSGSIFSEFKKHNCLMKSSDTLGIISSLGASPLAGFLEEGSSGICKTVSGNSGSPVVNTDGELIGILHGGVREGAEMEGEMTKNFSIITNLRCQKFKDGQMDKDYPATCPNENKESGMDNDNMEKKIDAAIAIEAEKALLKQPTYLKYKTVINNSVISFDPICVKPLVKWSAVDVNWIKDENAGQYMYALATQYKMSFKKTKDYYGNDKVVVTFKTNNMMEFIIGDLKTLATGNTQMRTRLFTDSALPSNSKTLPVCE